MCRNRIKQALLPSKGKPARTYKHWLLIDGHRSDECLQYAEIAAYLAQHKDAQATMYFVEGVLFNRVVLLQCAQSYKNLAMDVNTGTHGLRRLAKKPKGLVTADPQPFTVPNRYEQKAAERIKRLIAICG